MGRIQRRNRYESMAVLFAAVVSFTGVVLAESTVSPASQREERLPVIGERLAARDVATFPPNPGVR